MRNLKRFASPVLAAGVVLALAVVLPMAYAQAAQTARKVVCPVCGRNLILNPGAESGMGTNTDSVVKVPDWKGTGGFTAAQYAWPSGDLYATTRVPKDRGKNFFYGGPNSHESTATQLVRVPAKGISTGKAIYVLSGWLGGYDGQSDDATLYATFENASGKAISTARIGPVTEAQRHGNSELLYRRVSGRVPAATRAVLLKLVMLRYVGSDNDGLADNLSLVFSVPPGPSPSS